MVINSLIKELVEHVNVNNVPKKIDLILDGGAFNGVFQLGGLMYLKEMERNKIIGIDRISGVSIGSILGLAYIIDKLDIVIKYCNELMGSFRNKSSLKNFSKILSSFVINEMKDDDYLKLNGKLYISYYNNKTKSQVVKHTYHNNKQVEDTLKKSSFIPYLMGSSRYKDKFIDGTFPHIFKPSKSKKMLFIYLTSYSKIQYAINIKNEDTLHGRLIDGIFDVNKFFNKNLRTDMCSYVEDWNFFDFTIFRFREIIMVIMLFLIDSIQCLQKKIPDFITDSKQYGRLSQIFKQYYIDIVSNFLT